jgi:hypothetical protein
MARIYKESQVQGTAAIGTYATLYTTPFATTANISTISICNTAAAPATYRIAIMSTAGTPAAANWLVYGATVAANDTVFLTVGAVMSAGKYLRVSSSADTVSFTVFVSEVS